MFQKGLWAVGFFMLLGPSTLAHAGDDHIIASNAMTKVSRTETQYTLEGTLRFAGIPMSSFASIQPSFWFRDESTGMEYTEAVGVYNTSNSSYSISNLPSGETGISIVFHTVASEATLPGNFRTWIDVDPSLLTESQRKNFDIGFQTVMHLTQPWDNSLIESVMGEPYPVYPSPITFSWDPILEATSYSIIIYTYTDPDHPSGYGYVDTPVHTDFSSTTYVANLENNRPEEHYEFTVTAYSEYEAIGIYMTTYSGGYGGDYRFKVGGNLGTRGDEQNPEVSPYSFSLSQNYPNPFNPTTDIRYQIPDIRYPAHTTLKIFNILGQEVATLVDEVQEPGYHSLSWDASDMASGIYFYRLVAGDFTETKQMVLMK